MRYSVELRKRMLLVERRENREVRKLLTEQLSKGCVRSVALL